LGQYRPVFATLYKIFLISSFVATSPEIFKHD
jgi:hypothetical protein